MEIAEYKIYADNCFRDTPPPCAAVCPLSYDVREFVKLMQRGSLRGAYKVYRNGVIFPQIVSKLCPAYCGKTCVRGRLENERSVDLKSLEAEACAKMAGKKPERYAIPKKDENVYVAGGGLSGLACAYRAASFGYRVTVIEKKEHLGGSAAEKLDPQWLHEEILREFTAVDCLFRLNTEVTELPAGDKTAWYISTGKEGAAFETEDRPDIFRGGEMTGADPMEAIAQGMQAATAIDVYFKTGKAVFSTEVPERKPDERYYRLHYFPEQETQTASKGSGDSVIKSNPQSAVRGSAEAARCMRCSCSECYDVCPLMQKYKYYPKKLCAEIIATLKPNMSKRTGVRIIMGCTECGKCREACPESIDMGKAFSEARKDFYESGAMSPAFHDYWLRDMAFSESEEASLLYKKDPEKACDLMFFPGCQLGASEPDSVIKTFEAIGGTASNPGIMLGCCGVPAKWAGQEKEARKAEEKIKEAWEKLGRPPVVTACPTCLKNMKTILPEGTVRSLYPYLLEHPECLKKADAPCAVTVMDPCASAGDPGMQEAVRRLLGYCGCEVLNPKGSPGCCGFGGHIVSSVPDLAHTFAKHRIEGTEGVCAAYCANCKDVFSLEGRETRHVLGIFFGTDEENEPPSLDERRENRRALRRYFTKEVPPEKNENTEFRVPEELIGKMNRELLLLEEVKETVLEAEREKSAVADDKEGVFYAHRRFGTYTVWVEYRPENGGISVRNVYCHRMDIREDNG